MFAYAETTATYTASTGWTAVGNVTELTMPEPEADDIDTTSHSTTGGVRTYLAGLVDPGEAETTVHYDKTIFSTLKGLRGDSKKFRVIFSDGSGIGWEGYIKADPATEVDMEGLTLMTIKTKVSGDSTAITAVV